MRSDKSLTHRELEGPPKAVIINTGTCFVLVRYDYRKTPDKYAVLEGHPLKCIQCGAEFSLEKFSEHILSYYRKRHVPQEAGRLPAEVAGDTAS